MEAVLEAHKDISPDRNTVELSTRSWVSSPARKKTESWYKKCWKTLLRFSKVQLCGNVSNKYNYVRDETEKRFNWRNVCWYSFRNF